MRNVNKISKTLTYDNLIQQSQNLIGRLPVNTIAFRVDLHSSLNEGVIKIVDENNTTIVDSINVSKRFVLLSLIFVCYKNLYLNLVDKNPIEGNITVVIYYIYENNLIEFDFNYLDFSKSIIPLQTFNNDRLYVLYLEIEEEFDKGKIYIGDSEERDSVFSIDLEGKTKNQYFIEGINKRDLNLYFDENPTKGKAKLKIYYFSL